MIDDPAIASLLSGAAGAGLQHAAPPAIDRDWATQALALIETDQRRSADAHLLHFDVPALSGLSIYLKDKSTHPCRAMRSERN